MDKLVKMDLHTHTRIIKNGEKRNRNIPEEKEKEFIDSRVQKNVRIIGITNHNIFDEEQYLKLLSYVKDNELKIFPGVELDVNVNDTSEKPLIKPFNLVLNQSDFRILNQELFNKEYNPKKFFVEKAKFLSFISSHSSILLIPTDQKDGDLPKKIKEEIMNLESSNKNLVVFGQVSNARTAAIRNNGSDNESKYNSITGSDNENWNDFKNNGVDRLSDLPNIPNNINDFESLVKWLKRNQLYGQNVVDGYKLEFFPGSSENNLWGDKVKFDLRPGSTVIIGSRGSGKSVLLKNIAENLRKKTNLEIELFETSEETETKYNKSKREKQALLEEDLNGSFKETIDFQSIVDILDNARHVSYSNIKLNFDTLNRHLIEKRKNRYKAEFSALGSLMTNNGVKYQYTDDKDMSLKNKINDSLKDIRKIEDVLNMLQKYEKNEDFVFSEYDSLIEKLNALTDSIRNYILNFYMRSKTKKLIYVSKLSLSGSYSRKTNTTPSPKTKPLYQLWKERTKLKLAIAKFLSTKSISKTIKLGVIYNNKNQKEDLFVKSEVFIFSKESCEFYKKNDYRVECEKKASSKELISELMNVKNDFLNRDFFERSKRLKEVISENFVGDNAHDFTGFASKVCLKNGSLREPSSGEKQTMMLNNYLDQDKEFYLMDEPEKSLDNKFVYEAIVKKIIDLIGENKYVIFSTHNANLAVLTDPDLIIYRKIQDDFKYPISLIGPDKNNRLKNSSGTIIENWKEIAKSILEGGSDAFEERGDYYGRKTSK